MMSLPYVGITLSADSDKRDDVNRTASDYFAVKDYVENWLCSNDVLNQRRLKGRV